MAEEKKEGASFTLRGSVTDNTLVVTLINQDTKEVYRSAFTRQQLQKQCGFSESQSSNMTAMCRFIDSVQSSKGSVSVSIKITSSKRLMSSESEGAVVDTNQRREVALVVLTKMDDIFGSVTYSLRLPKGRKYQSEINGLMISSLQKQLDSLKMRSGIGLNVLASQTRVKLFHCTAGWGSSAVKQFNIWAAPLGGRLKIFDVQINVCNSTNSALQYLIHVAYRLEESSSGTGPVTQMTHFCSNADWGKRMIQKTTKWLESTQGSQIRIQYIIPIVRNHSNDANALYYLTFYVYSQ